MIKKGRHAAAGGLCADCMDFLKQCDMIEGAAEKKTPYETARKIFLAAPSFI